MKNLDKVTLVDKNDNVIGEMDKIEAHRGNARLHRASSVYLFRKNPQTQVVELLFQKRSSKKIVGESQWGNTICGNVRPTENYKECALRRLREEIGVVLEIEESTDENISGENIIDVYNFTYQLKCNDEFSEHEIDHVFVGEYNGELSLNPDEVEESTWINWEDLVEEMTTLELKEFLPEGMALKSINNIIVNPWTLLMLSDRKLIKVINNYLKLKL